MYRLYYFCIVIAFLVGFYFFTDWASRNPEVFADVHQKMDQTADMATDKATRAGKELVEND